MKDKISKLKNIYEKDGFKVFIKKITRYLGILINSKLSFIARYKFKKNKNNYEKEINKILNNKYERIIIWRSSFGWNVPLYQRPQHIFNNLAKQNCLIFYEVTKMTDDVSTIKSVHDNLYLVNFNNKLYFNLLISLIKKLNKPKYLEFFSTDWTLSLEDIKEYEKNNFKIIYEYIDDLSSSVTGTKEIPKNVLDKYNYAMKNKNIYVIVSADLLLKDVISKRGKENVAYSSNGVDYQHFLTYDKNYEFEASFLQALQKPTICYYGALANWFDYDLIKEINDANKYNIVLFGSKYDSSFMKSNIENLKNVYYLGVKNYQVLKNYAHKVDILIIPFLINDITKSTSPVKLYEYMALHKPIVTTNMNECAKYKSVLIGINHQDFMEKLDKAYLLKNDQKYLKLLDQEAKENDWYYKAESIIALVKKDEK